MYLKINNFNKILEAPHPSYTCTGCEETEKSYIIYIANDEGVPYSYKVIINRVVSISSFTEYSFRIESTNIANGFDYGLLQSKDLKSRTILFKLLCESIEQIKVFK
jgi:hypothetical protein